MRKSIAYGKHSFIGLRFGAALLLAILLLAAFSAALAEERPTNPYYQQVQEAEKKLNRALKEEGKDVSNDVTAVALNQVTAPTLGGVGKWSLYMNESVYGTATEATAYLFMQDYSSDYSVVYRKVYNNVPDLINSCTIMSGGNYIFAVYVEFENGIIYDDQVQFTIQDDDNHTSITEKIAQVVAQCRASTQWQTALNLHNWLTMNLYYDHTLTYYGVDAILRGYGVCDGYSKSFLMMCRNAGIPVYRVRGGNHSWNALCLDGAWYYVDCTWDDPGEATTAVSGSERQTYFCLNEELTALDHEGFLWEDTDKKACTALDDNYFVRLALWNKIGNWFADESGNVSSYSNEIGSAIAAGEMEGSVPFNFFYFIDEDGGGYSITKLSDESYRRVIIRSWTLLAYALSHADLPVDGFGSARVQVSLNENAKRFDYAVQSIGPGNKSTLKIPANVTSIEESSFAGVSAGTVIIPSGCRKIGSLAFANSGIRVAHVPESVVNIAEDAFENCGTVLFICVDGSEASLYADDHDFPHIEQ